MTDRNHENATHEDVRQDEELTRRLAALPREIDPPRDLWHGIEARIESRTAASPLLGSKQPGSKPLASWPVWAGLAAMLLLAVLLAVSWQWIGPQPPEGLPSAELPNGATDPTTGTMTEVEVLAWHARQEDRTFVTRQALETVLGTARETGSLTPDATAGLAESLAALDRAIGETRAALDRDPANPQLRLLLAQRYQQEAALLHRVRSL